MLTNLRLRNVEIFPLFTVLKCSYLVLLNWTDSFFRAGNHSCLVRKSHTESFLIFLRPNNTIMQQMIKTCSVKYLFTLKSVVWHLIKNGVWTKCVLGYILWITAVLVECIILLGWETYSMNYCFFSSHSTSALEEHYKLQHP